MHRTMVQLQQKCAKYIDATLSGFTPISNKKDFVF